MKRLALMTAICLLFAGSAMAATTADVIFVVDESGSMAGEHTWLGSMVTSLDASLIAAGVTGNQYGLVGFGSGYTYGYDARTVSGFADAATVAAATSSLVLTGGTEDGWMGINYALNNYSFRSNAAVNIVLVTDEDRDNCDGGASTYANTLANLNSNNAILNAVVNAGTLIYDSQGNITGVNSGLQASDGTDALGLSSTAGYVADGSGGFTEIGGPGSISYAYGTTKTNYIDMAWATSGAAWDLNQLRAGGLTADSFTAAFVDIKTEEIQTQDPPAPTAVLLGLIGLGYAGRKLRRFV